MTFHITLTDRSSGRTITTDVDASGAFHAVIAAVEAAPEGDWQATGVIGAPAEARRPEPRQMILPL